MTHPAHPTIALYGGEAPLPSLPACVHYAGQERFIRKALTLQQSLGPVFDIACDCEDGAPIGREREHAESMAALIASVDNRFDRVGARVHDLTHRASEDDVGILIGVAGVRLAFLTLPKVERVADVEQFLRTVRERARESGIDREIPVSVLIETPAGAHAAWEIAALPGVTSLDFGTLDFVSAHRGAIPLSAMQSPGQFDHPLVRRAKCEVAAAALAHGKVPAHGVTLALDGPTAAADATRARNEFGYLRMWSIHPSQIEPIVHAFQPDAQEIGTAADILLAAYAAHWAPIRFDDRLHDRASYRYFWNVLQQAQATRAPLPAAALHAFFEASP